MRDPIVIYHWWADKDEQPAYSNLSHPLLLSIATLRAVNQTIPIKVLNCSNYSPEKSDWLHFQDKLNFQVWGCEFFLEKYSDVVGYKLLSRLFDLRQMRHSQWPVIYCDSDVFWLRDPLPLACDINKFCFDGFNSGFFYYDYDSPTVKEMFEVFDAYTITALRDKQFCQMIKDKTNYDAWPYIWDETILRYMNETGMSHLFEIVPPEEHGVIRESASFNRDKLKMLHCNGLMIKNQTAKRLSEKEHSRGLACLLFKEFYENVCKVLDENDLRMIFTENEMQNALSQQMSLFDTAEIEQMKRADSNYEFVVRSAQSQWLI